jgi:predicted HTH transcriptional regulator
LIAESLYLTRYIEKAGSGTQRMIDLCREAGLPAPDFEQRQGSFVLTLWRDWLTEEFLAALNLNGRQLKAIAHVKTVGRITNVEFQKLAGTSRRTALRELAALVNAGILLPSGSGRGSVYLLAGKRARNAPNAPLDDETPPKKNAP